MNAYETVGAGIDIDSGNPLGHYGDFVRELETYGFTSIQIASLRIMVAAVLFLAVSCCGIKRARIRMRDMDGFGDGNRQHSVVYGVLFYCHVHGLSVCGGNFALHCAGDGNADVPGTVS